jgi:predicted transcriptional regulator
MNDEKQKIQVKYESDMETGVYSNAASVHLTNNEIVLDFGYVIPNVKPTTLKIVSRVNLNHTAAESLLKILSNAVLDFKNKNNKDKKE